MFFYAFIFLPFVKNKIIDSSFAVRRKMEKSLPSFFTIIPVFFRLAHCEKHNIPPPKALLNVTRGKRRECFMTSFKRWY